MFPPEVKEKAMVACGRRCCLCHKFCGVKMECNHIVRPRDGGTNTDDNCIPLCFDCHAEVGHYDDAHPKGVKFRPAELRAHRDRWYKKFQSGISVDAPADHQRLDAKFFQKLVTALGGSQKMLHYRDHDYAGTYPVVVDYRLHAFADAVELPEAEFFDLEMESAFSDLKGAVDAYLESKFGYVYHNTDGTAGVPSEWCKEDGTPPDDRFWPAVKKLNEKATSIWNAYCQFIKFGRLRLNIEMHDAPTDT